MDVKTKPFYSMFLILSGAMLALIMYYYAYPLWAGIGLRNIISDTIIYNLLCSGIMDSQITVRSVCLFFCTISVIVRSGNSRSSSWPEILLPLLSGLAMFLLAARFNGIILLVLTLTGYILYFSGAVLLGRKYRSFNPNLPDYMDTFPQCQDLIENEYSINIPIVYQYKSKKHKGFINVVSPFRGSLVIGTPGSGKSYSIYGPFIRQMIQKGYSLFVYDYKYPDLTNRVLNELIDNYDCYDIKPKMYVVNFDDPLYSHRFNPLNPAYLTDPVDATEIAEIIMKNANRGSGQEKDDFFSLSAKCYIDLLIWFLKIYDGGKYCTFPHLIELMGQDYRDVFDVLKKYDELEVKRNTFEDAIKDKAYEQLQGQIASARVPLNRFASKTLYWTLSADDFSLQINDPQHPEIICVGNNPKRQSIYGTTLAMLASQLFKVINIPGKRHCAVLIDELPTIYLKDLSNLIDTARSNHVAVVAGAQDKAQLIRDYGKKEADVIFNTIGNLFAGAVKGETAASLSKSFGKIEQETRSYQEGASSEHITLSYQMRDILPPDRIESLSQGVFCGYVSDTFAQKIHPKIFCGEIDAGKPSVHNESIPQIIRTSRENLNVEVEKNYRKIHQDICDMLQRELNSTAKRT